MARQRRPLPQGGRSVFLRSPSIVAPVNGFTLTLLGPANGITYRERRPDIVFRVTRIPTGPVDVQVEWRRQQPDALNLPAPVYAYTILGLASGGDYSTEPPVDLAFGDWFYRLRAGNNTTNTWGAWSPSNRRLQVSPVLGSVRSYMDMNVGVAPPGAVGTVAYMDMNVGIEPVTEIDSAVAGMPMNVGVRVVDTLERAVLYTDMNFGVIFTELAFVAYTDFNVVTDQVPTPQIWWIRPEQGREGFVFNIYGHGFGALQTEYNGEVRLGDLVCTIARWERIPGETPIPPEGYVIKKGVGLGSDEITAEHGWIVAIVPTGAVSGLVKVVLEDS